MLSYITKHFGGPKGRQLAPGEIVDTTDWTHEAKLQKHRYMRPAPTGATVTSTTPASTKPWRARTAAGKTRKKKRTPTRSTAHAAG